MNFFVEKIECWSLRPRFRIEPTKFSKGYFAQFIFLKRRFIFMWYAKKERKEFMEMIDTRFRLNRLNGDGE